MKFYYENEDFRNTPNGNGFCTVSNLDWHYGFNNPVFELLDDEHIVWNFSIQGEIILDNR